MKHLESPEISARTLRIPHPYTEEDADHWLEIVDQQRKEQGRPTSFAIRREDGKLIGAIGFEGSAVGTSHRREIGYWLAKPFWGRGLMTSVVRTACEHAFTQWGLAKITAHVFDFNRASARLLEKCGFQLEGRFQQHYVKGDRFINALAYGLLRPKTD